MDKIEWQRLRDGASTLGVALSDEAAEQLLVFRSELLRWNQKINLTAITDPAEVLEKHFLDSLIAVPECMGAARLLDLGAGAGLPGIPIKLAVPGLELSMVDSVAKKVGFQKHAIALLKLTNARALHARAAGEPTKEGIGLADAIISRALMPLDEWVPLAGRYLTEHGRLIAMLSTAPEPAALEEMCRAGGYASAAVRSAVLPWSKAARCIVQLVR